MSEPAEVAEGPAEVASCAWFRELASGELDGEVTPAEGALLHEHLVGCAACRDTRRGVRRAVWLVRGVLGWGALATLVAAPAMGREPGPGVCLEDAALGRSRMEHMVRADVTLPSVAAAQTRAREGVRRCSFDGLASPLRNDPVPPVD